MSRGSWIAKEGADAATGVELPPAPRLGHPPDWGGVDFCAQSATRSD